ncbi:NAD-dependent epimerase/dehydratase family protein [Marinobacter halodurans]|uniref:NAD-dependent epimerase/dehydratase family protein n=1 Tax=Marinobacter halodurans TaxID=2528979 RepID=A0ABY1ZU40_9GAMM|nr:NAD-dependent epimerase/dehydratase family protein [Marinobacter halodurans]TBW59398.1 NAD-dependent epimerase/dehydratase family protein [Marinobacter halodurans]
MRVLVTGANGHIGSHVVRQLIEQGHSARAFVRPSADLRGLEGLDVDLFRGDIMDAQALTEAAQGMDAIIHMAAVYKTIARSPDEIVEPAIQGARNVFAAAQANRIQRIVYTSSVASVGFSYDPQELRTGDDWNNDPSNPYYIAKTRSEQTAQKLAEESGIHLVVICPAIVLGPGDYRVTPSNQLVMDWLNGVGQTYPGGLNLVDVRDVAAAHVAALTRGENRRRYVVGGENVEVRQAALLLKRLTGIKPMHLPFGRGMLLWSAKWTERVCRLFGVTPPFTYDLVYEVAERYAYIDTRETNETFGLAPRNAEQTLQACIQWLLDQGRLKPRAADQVRAALGSQ